LDEVKQLPLELRELDASCRGTLTIGVPPTIGPFLLPPALGLFTQENPDIRIVVEEKTTAQLIPILAEGRMDLAIVTLPIPDGRFAVEELLTEELVLCVPSKHSLVKQARIGRTNLRDQSFIVLKDGHSLAEQTGVFFQEHAIRPHIVLETHQIDLVQALVSTGLGMALIPAMAQRHPFSSVLYRPMKNPKLTRTIGVAWRKLHTHSCAATSFLCQLRRIAKDFNIVVEKGKDLTRSVNH
jgi:LysR family hydrogen peroxide-inducible transcriptional activator